MSNKIDYNTVLAKTKALWQPSDDLHLAPEQIKQFSRQEKIPATLSTLLPIWEARFAEYRNAYVEAYVNIGVLGLKGAQPTSEDIQQFNEAEYNLNGLPGVIFDQEKAGIAAAFQVATESYKHPSRLPTILAATAGSALALGAWTFLPRKETPPAPTSTWEEKTVATDDSKISRSR